MIGSLGVGTLGVLFWVGVALVVLALWRSASVGLLIPTVVLQSWDEAASAAGDLVTVRGRRQGLVAFILQVLGIDPQFKLVVRSGEIELSGKSLTGQHFHRIPIHRVSSTIAGFTRPLHWVVLAAGFLAIAVVGAETPWGRGIAAALALACAGAFVLSKAVFVTIHCDGGPPIALRVKGSMLDAKTVDLGAAQRLMRLVGDLTLKFHRALEVTDAPSPDWTRPSGRPGDPSSATRVAMPQGPMAEPTLPPPPPVAYCDYCGRQGFVGQPCANCQRIVE